MYRHRERFLLKHCAMANTLVHLRAKLADCKPQLEVAQRKSDAIFKAASGVQRTSMVDLLQRFPLSPEDFINGTAAEMMDLVMASNLSNEDMELIFVHLQPPVSKEHPKKGKKMSQDFINFHKYMPESLQREFVMFSQNKDQDGALTVQQLQAKLFEFLADLGMRNADEFTYKRMSSVILVHTETPEMLRLLTPKCKHVLKNTVRDAWMKSSNHEKLPSFCQSLPEDTAIFSIKHADLYNGTMKHSSPPKICLLKMLEVLAFEGTYSCRNAGRHHHEQVVL